MIKNTAPSPIICLFCNKTTYFFASSKTECEYKCFTCDAHYYYAYLPRRKGYWVTDFYIPLEINGSNIRMYCYCSNHLSVMCKLIDHDPFLILYREEAADFIFQSLSKIKYRLEFLTNFS